MSRFNPSFNTLKCNIFRFISKVIDPPLPYEINLFQDINALDDNPLLACFLDNLATLRDQERFIGGLKVHYERNREIHFILLTPTRILSLIQKGEKSNANVFFFRDITSINQRNYPRKGMKKTDIEIQFSKGSLTWKNVELTYNINHFLKSIRTLAKENK